MFALDTNALIHFFKDEGRVGTRLRETSPRLVAVPAPVIYELETGIAKSTQPQKRRGQLDAILEVVKVLPLERRAAKRCALLRAEMEVLGTPLGPIDYLVAGIALEHRATLVTRNTREFSRVPGLSIVDWF